MAQLRSHTPRNNYPVLQGRPPIEVIVQDTLDTSELAQFYCYETVWYWDYVNRNGFPNSGEKLGRILGIAHDRVQAMCLYVAPLQSNKPTANFVYNARSMVRSVLPEELYSQDFKKRLATLYKSIEIKCGDTASLSEVEEYGKKMGNFDEEAQPFKHRLPIDDGGITHNSYDDEGHAIPDQDDEPTPEQTD